VALPKLLRFADLKRIGLVGNWPTLKRRIESQAFPPGRLLGPNTRVWTETEVELWFVSRPEHREDPPPENAAAANSCSSRSGGGAIDASAGKPKHSRNKRLETASQASSTDEEAT
jgi:hypothetical protein